ncbi:MarR family winged helix-turn-helix transcriptional regulator [Bradyrhizobium sp. LTSP857]|jgi:MarR family transcriptional repressor of emrRAB|uniref:MarR family winged helix-turn-helix transcriptional regulator n=1 Tax=Bradyrhizobium sp. LTSP857 TaxID=1619231 RepID=UPI0007C7D19D|nr:MarR family winged helix-turn-helix transcriptional regulator [Bradyrhizobium sp. LTSP857]
MHSVREAVELQIQLSKFWHFDGNRHGLRDREWLALRFLGRANRFSRTPSALAAAIGATKAATSPIVKILVKKSLLVRKQSLEDKRSVTLEVTPLGERHLAQHDPINLALSAMAELGDEDRVALLNSLRDILSRIDSTHQCFNIGVCRDCMFLAEQEPHEGKGRKPARFRCRLYRTPITFDETALQCTSFERTHHRPKTDKHLSRLVSQAGDASPGLLRDDAVTSVASRRRGRH